MKQLVCSLFAGFLLLQAAVAAETEWLTDLNKAKAAAKQDHKMILLDFTGSDW